METKSIKLLLLSITIGIWVIVIQNFVKSNQTNTQSVEVVNSVDVRGKVEVEGIVDVENTVDINISKINGHGDVFYNNYDRDPNKYYRLPVIAK